MKSIKDRIEKFRKDIDILSELTSNPIVASMQFDFDLRSFSILAVCKNIISQFFSKETLIKYSLKEIEENFIKIREIIYKGLKDTYYTSSQDLDQNFLFIELIRAQAFNKKYITSYEDKLIMLLKLLADHNINISLRNNRSDFLRLLLSFSIQGKDQFIRTCGNAYDFASEELVEEIVYTSELILPIETLKFCKTHVQKLYELIAKYGICPIALFNTFPDRNPEELLEEYKEYINPTWSVSSVFDYYNYNLSQTEYLRIFNRPLYQEEFENINIARRSSHIFRRFCSKPFAEVLYSIEHCFTEFDKISFIKRKALEKFLEKTYINSIKEKLYIPPSVYLNLFILHIKNFNFKGFLNLLNLCLDQVSQAKLNSISISRAQDKIQEALRQFSALLDPATIDEEESYINLSLIDAIDEDGLFSMQPELEEYVQGLIELALYFSKRMSNEKTFYKFFLALINYLENKIFEDVKTKCPEDFPKIHKCFIFTISKYMRCRISRNSWVTIGRESMSNAAYCIFKLIRQELGYTKRDLANQFWKNYDNLSEIENNKATGSNFDSIKLFSEYRYDKLNKDKLRKEDLNNTFFKSYSYHIGIRRRQKRIVSLIQSQNRKLNKFDTLFIFLASKTSARDFSCFFDKLIKKLNGKNAEWLMDVLPDEILVCLFTLTKSQTENLVKKYAELKANKINESEDGSDTNNVLAALSRLQNLSKECIIENLEYLSADLLKKNSKLTTLTKTFVKML